MIDIVFSDSACGSLKAAQHCGKGEYLGGSVGVIISHHDGSEPTQEEIATAQKEAERRQRQEWEQAVPLGGNVADVFGFWLCFSIGDISEARPGIGRQQVIRQIFSVYPDCDDDEFIRNIPQSVAETLAVIRARLEQGELLRIWSSDQPDDACGLHWFMAWLADEKIPHGEVLLVRLPQWNEDEAGAVQTISGWGEVSPGQWHRYLPLAKPVSESYIKSCAEHWRRLQKENMPLRAVLNGQLVSLPDTAYDSFIAREIAAEEAEFQEAMVIGRVLGNYCLGIGDAWISLRIEEMIRAGQLEPVTAARKDSPIYHRMLRKTAAWDNNGW